MSEAALRIDVSGTTCPMTFVKVKVALEGLAPGEVLEALLNSDEHPREVPPSVREEGHDVLAVEPHGEGVLLRIRKAAGEGG